jgi:DivIVA domain-containing protein
LTGDDLRQVQFREKFRGYAADDVDAALDRLADALDRSGRLPRADIDDLEFGHTWRGYHPDDVDAFLERLRTEAC